MKVVHLVAADIGGAYRAAERINASLREIGVSSEMVLLEKKHTNNKNIFILSNQVKTIIFKIQRRINEKIMLKKGLGFDLYYAKLGVDILKIPTVRNADVINLHWINNGMISYKGLERLCHSGKKIVWTLHDMYAFTAGCYYDNECGNYTHECTECKYAKGNVYIQKIVNEMYARKKKAYSNIAFVGCSHWMSDCATNSSLCRNFPVHTIPNPIDTFVFFFEDKKTAADKLNIQLNEKKIIAFGAMSANSDQRKGFIYLLRAISHLNKSEYRVVVFGNDEDQAIETGLETVYLGKINRDDVLRSVYSLADVFVAPSKQENLSNAVMESIACGTPVTAFSIGGMRDMIDHMKTGYLATPFDDESLYEGIVWCTEHKQVLKKSCEEKVQRKFLPILIGRMYKDVYESN